jgi:hypothetical protein
MIMVALSNDYHFWGLERDPSCEDDQEGPDQDVAEYPCTDRIAEIWNEDVKPVNFNSMPAGMGPLGSTNGNFDRELREDLKPGPFGSWSCHV